MEKKRMGQGCWCRQCGRHLRRGRGGGGRQRDMRGRGLVRRGDVGRRDGVEDDRKGGGLGLVGGENGGRRRDMRGGGLVRRGGVGRRDGVEDDRRGWRLGFGGWREWRKAKRHERGRLGEERGYW